MTLLMFDHNSCHAYMTFFIVTPLEGSYFENNVGYECFTPNVLNLGISPAILIANVAKRFKENGGTILEKSPLKGIVISESMGAALDMGEDAEPITTKLVLDCMGNASPISRQQRYGRKPDGVCAVVGSCAGGFDKQSNLLGDIVSTFIYNEEAWILLLLAILIELLVNEDLH